MRAAFKAVMDGKQVAVLAPTTVLAQQHFEVFRQRMLEYPVRIEMLSRFRSHSEQKTVLRLLREGGVDIVIGTHRLISGDVVFKNLGLVIIDEEQRFRSSAEGEIQRALQAGRCADTFSHADSAHPLSFSGWRKRHVHDRDSPAQPSAGRNRGIGVR